MAEISLEKLMQQRKNAEGANLTPVDEETEKAAIEKVVAKITPEERRLVDEIKDKIDLTDTSASLAYGSDFSDTILSGVRSEEAEDIGALLGELSGKVKSLEAPEDKSFIKRLPLIGSLVDKGENMLENYEKLSTRIDKIQSSLEKAKQRMMKDVVMFDNLYDKNLQYFKALQLYILAGEEKLKEMRDETLPKLRRRRW